MIGIVATAIAVGSLAIWAISVVISSIVSNKDAITEEEYKKEINKK